MQVSPPLVAFKESVATRGTTDGYPPAAEATTPNGLCTLRVWALPIPGATTRVLQESEQLLRQTHSGAQAGANPHRPTF
jgi:ribosome assembly protein 1